MILYTQEVRETHPNKKEDHTMKELKIWEEMELTDEEIDEIAEEVELMDAMEHGIALW